MSSTSFAAPEPCAGTTPVGLLGEVFAVGVQPGGLVFSGAHRGSAAGFAAVRVAVSGTGVGRAAQHLPAARWRIGQGWGGQGAGARVDSAGDEPGGQGERGPSGEVVFGEVVGDVADQAVGVGG